MTIGRAHPSVEEYVYENMLVPEEGECVLWTGARTSSGYGLITHYGTQTRAHRWVYEHWFEEIPEGMEIHHLCKVKLCVNPLHLIAIEPREHRIKYHRSQFCPQGHEKIQVGYGWRCYECEKLLWRKRHAEDPERFRAASRSYYWANVEEQRERRKRFRARTGK